MTPAAREMYSADIFTARCVDAQHFSLQSCPDWRLTANCSRALCQLPSTDLYNATFLQGCPLVDLLIRTSGETRLSDFLLPQCAHAGLQFSAVLWPEFSFLDMLAALAQYQRDAATLRRVADAAAENCGGALGEQGWQAGAAAMVCGVNDVGRAGAQADETAGGMAGGDAAAAGKCRDGGATPTAAAGRTTSGANGRRSSGAAVAAEDSGAAGEQQGLRSRSAVHNAAAEQAAGGAAQEGRGSAAAAVAAATPCKAVRSVKAGASTALRHYDVVASSGRAGVAIMTQ